MVDKPDLKVCIVSTAQVLWGKKYTSKVFSNIIQILSTFSKKEVGHDADLCLIE